MTSSNSTSGFGAKATRRVAMTATALAAVLVLGAEQELPSRYYALHGTLVSGYQWQTGKVYGQAPSKEYRSWHNEAASVFPGIRGFTSDEARIYSEYLGKQYKATGVSFFDL